MNRKRKEVLQKEQRKRQCNFARGRDVEKEEGHNDS